MAVSALGTNEQAVHEPESEFMVPIIPGFDLELRSRFRRGVGYPNIQELTVDRISAWDCTVPSPRKQA